MEVKLLYEQIYCFLLRGINISRKNKIAMSELKEGFIKLHFTDISTYLNSGNVIFQVILMIKIFFQII